MCVCVWVSEWDLHTQQRTAQGQVHFFSYILLLLFRGRRRRLSAYLRHLSFCRSRHSLDDFKMKESAKGTWRTRSYTHFDRGEMMMMIVMELRERDSHHHLLLTSPDWMSTNYFGGQISIATSLLYFYTPYTLSNTITNTNLSHTTIISYIPFKKSLAFSLSLSLHPKKNYDTSSN